MKIDRYTKIILTIIALALVTLSARWLEEPTQVLAQGPTRVVIAGIEGQQLQRGLPVYLYASNPQQPLSVNLSQLAGGQAQSLPVTVVGTGTNVLVPVKLTVAGQEGKSAVPVNVVQVAGTAIDQAGIPVVNQK